MADNWNTGALRAVTTTTRGYNEEISINRSRILTAGLADQLAAELRITVDVIGVRGSGATPARVNLLRRAKADEAYLAGKKAVIWCFAAREFTESNGWSLVPFSSVARPAGTTP